MRFRKKPVVIEATQWFKSGDHPSVYTKRDSASDQWGYIKTLEGEHVVTPGDWIITGVKGEVYPCKPDIFALTYEPVAQEPTEHKVTKGEICDRIDELVQSYMREKTEAWIVERDTIRAKIIASMEAGQVLNRTNTNGD